MTLREMPHMGLAELRERVWRIRQATTRARRSINSLRDTDMERALKRCEHEIKMIRRKMMKP